MLSLEAQQIIAGRYRLERALAQGGMGAVWVAQHLQLDRAVAVKFMAPELAASADARARFEREAKASAQLKSPNVVQVHDYGVEHDTPFLVMELLEGEDLETRLARERRLSPAEMAAVLVPVCRALRRAHDVGLVHRDLKPGNIFLAHGADEVVPKVLDFGIAKIQGAGLVGSSTKTGALLGSPHYMSPEQVRKSRSVDHRSDLWSMGVIAFRCLTGELPFPGDEIGEVLVAICAEPIPRASGIAEGLGPEVDRFFERALARDPEQRFQSARDLAEAIAALAGEAGRGALALSIRGSGDAAALPAAPSVALGDAPTMLGEPPPAAPAPAIGDAATVFQAAAAPAPGASTPAAAPPVLPTPSAKPASDTVASISRTLASATGDPGTALPPAPAPPAIVAPPAPRRLRTVLLAAAAALIAGAALLALKSIPRASPWSDPPGASATLASSLGPRCTTHRACTDEAGGRPALCRRDDGACVPLASVDCRVLADPGDVENEATVWFGAMLPEHDTQGTGPRAAKALDLARRDFAKVGGLLPATAGGPKRPLAIVLCDDAADASASRAAAHLVDLRVPAVIGFARSREVLDLAPSLFVPRGVLALAANAASTLRDVPRAPGGERLVWRISPSVDAVVPALAALLADVVEPELRGRPPAIVPTPTVADAGPAPARHPSPPLLAADEGLRVTLVRGSTTSGQSYADLLVATLRFNDKDVAQNHDRFREVAVDAALRGDEPAWRERAADIASHRPHVVLVAGASPGLIPALEQAWPAAEKLRPRYLVGAALGAPALQVYANDHPDLAARIAGVSTLKQTNVLTRFSLHYQDVFGAGDTSPADVTVEDGESAPYDGFYLLAYAAAAAGAEPLTGPALARAIPHLLPPGERVEVGPGGIYAALYALSAGKTIDLDGASTSLDFDPATGDPMTDLAVDCLVEGHHDHAVHQIESPLFFRARTRKLEGTPRCP